jgi:prophage regulatory protein
MQEAENFFRLPTVEMKTGKSRSEIYADMAEGKFPKPVRIGERAVAWRESEIASWQQQRVQARDGGA